MHALDPTDYNYSAGPEIQLCDDGKYRWVYELNMFRNPTIFLTVFKIFFWIIFIGWAVFGFFLYVIHADWQGLWGMTKAAGIGLGVFLVLTILGYLAVAAMYKGKYIVLFEMDEKGIAHIQIPRQFKKAEVLGLIAAMAGLAAGRPSAAGAGLLAATKQSSTSEFVHVKKVKAYRRRNLIKVNQLLNKNQVYPPAGQFDFVYEFIKAHCPNAK